MVTVNYRSNLDEQIKLANYREELSLVLRYDIKTKEVVGHEMFSSK